MFERSMMRMAYALVIAGPSIAVTAATGADDTDLTIDRLYDTQDFGAESAYGDGAAGGR